MTFSEEQFKELVPKAATVHPMTYCIKRGPILTLQLLKLKCFECREFVLNGGVCDPL